MWLGLQYVKPIRLTEYKVVEIKLSRMEFILFYFILFTMDILS